MSAFVKIYLSGQYDFRQFIPTLSKPRSRVEGWLSGNLSCVINLYD
jgi:hypothetical protein